MAVPATTAARLASGEVAPAPLDSTLFDQFFTLDVVEGNDGGMSDGGPDGPSAADRAGA